jgi:hypothetical protein
LRESSARCEVGWIGEKGWQSKERIGRDAAEDAEVFRQGSWYRAHLFGYLLVS